MLSTQDNLLNLLNFFPFFGSAKYSIEAVLAQFNQDDRRARDKGIKGLVSAIIDLCVLLLFLTCAIQVSVLCERSVHLKMVKPIFNCGLLIAVVAVLIGSKIVAEQMSKSLVEKVLNVNQASSAMVNSVTLTATGIEAVVNSFSRTSNATATTFVSCYELVFDGTKTALFYSLMMVKLVINFYSKLFGQLFKAVELVFITWNYLTFELPLNLITSWVLFVHNITTTITLLPYNYYIELIIGKENFNFFTKLVLKIVEILHLVMANGISFLELYDSKSRNRGLNHH